MPKDVLELIYVFASSSKAHLDKSVLPFIATSKTVENGCEGCYIAQIANARYCDNCAYGESEDVGPRSFRLLNISEDRDAYNLVRALKDPYKIITALNHAEYRRALKYDLSRGPMIWTPREARAKVLTNRFGCPDGFFDEDE